MNRARFDLALEKIEPTNWKRFEEFSSAFLVGDYPNLRTVAAPSGDEGRDAELFSPQSEPEVVLQYSVTKDWPTKLRGTLRKVKSNLSGAKVLIYVTNQKIGAAADARTRHTSQGARCARSSA
jgi:hypothetical protein